MKIVELCGLSRQAGGLFYAVSSLCKQLQAAGSEIVVMGPECGLPPEDLAVWKPISPQAYRSIGPLGTGVHLRRRLLKTGADLVHQHGIWKDDQWAAMHWQKRTDKPVVVSPHGMLDPWAVRNSAWKKQIVEKLFAREALDHATCIHALCRSEAESIRAYGLKNPIAIIPNGVDLPEFDRSTFNVQRLKSNPKGKLLYLGRIHPKKGLKELIEAWSMTHGAWREEWQLLIAGWDDGGHLDDLTKQASALGLLTENAEHSDSSIQFIGPKHGEEKDRLLRNVDAFILPSFSEGLPMSVLEAWAYGLPVIMTDCCNLPEGFESGAAIRVEPYAASIYQGLESMISMKEDDLKVMGIKGRNLVEQRFTWNRIAHDILKVYEWCYIGGATPECVELTRTV